MRTWMRGTSKIFKSLRNRRLLLRKATRERANSKAAYLDEEEMRPRSRCRIRLIARLARNEADGVNIGVRQKAERKGCTSQAIHEDDLEKQETQRMKILHE